MDIAISKPGFIHYFKWGFQSKINNRMANSVDPDEMAHYKPSRLGLHCLQKYQYWSVGMKRLNAFVIILLVRLHL